MTPTLEQRCSSWANYCELFAARSTPRADVLLLSLTPLQVVLGGNVNMQLPNLWLWEMIDEFIYQARRRRARGLEGGSG